MFSRGYEAIRGAQGPSEGADEGEELKRIPSQGALRYERKTSFDCSESMPSFLSLQLFNQSSDLHIASGHVIFRSVAEATLPIP